MTNGNAQGRRGTVSADKTELYAGGQPPKPKQGLLDGISMSQVAGTGLAAVTSVALSSQIGIVGSFIGAAVAAIVSTVGAQIYATILSNSADKLRNWHNASSPDTPSGFAALTDDAAQANDNPYVAGGSRQGFAYRTDTSRPGHAHAHGEVGGTGTPVGFANGQHARIAPERLREEAAERHQRIIRRRVALVTLACGLVAVAATAGVITLATGGKGLGTKVGASAPATTVATESASTSTKSETANTGKAQAGTATQSQKSSSPSTSAGEGDFGSNPSSSDSEGSGDTSGSAKNGGSSSSQGSSGNSGSGTSGNSDGNAGANSSSGSNSGSGSSSGAGNSGSQSSANGYSSASGGSSSQDSGASGAN